MHSDRIIQVTFLPFLISESIYLAALSIRCRYHHHRPHLDYVTNARLMLVRVLVMGFFVLGDVVRVMLVVVCSYFGGG